MTPTAMKINIHEKILVHFFNYVMEKRRLYDLEMRHKIRDYHTGPINILTYGLDKPEYDYRELVNELTDAELQNWKVQLIEDMIRGSIDFKNEER
jgi:hypothetical protein